ncbi:hypothetical protein ASPZODRAFT_75497 [Penicilliopsis zonata CBS 506.65]|uniref:EXS domain-containing protein n=1 Tax=Penicilliopsis zonata CBS 506.65 TaxID=1073090 RepID=A0A1L9S712_9EURO|nr:hypothetical protein ASPZODRAFT_75497 [Penicilliopsis zonata CBS 506.65]OJJ42949.1 hypothetical protein ASPZODRAFT_75497 [Penicilliopsis zonata CBS 506.65]
MGPDQHAQLDDFSRVLPLPYRVAVILVAGFWGWGLNLQYLSKTGVDVPALIRYPPRQTSHQRSHHASVYHFATLLTVPLVLSILLFWAVTHGSAEQVEHHDYIPQSYLFIFFFILFLPFPRLARAGRQRFFVTLKRISIGGLAVAQDGKFGDILLADALTSYAKVFGDLFVSFCMFFRDGVSSTEKPDRNCGNDWIFPLIVATPSLIRLRQCLIEYMRVQRAGPRKENWGGQHLANALKYFTAFPVIFLAAEMRNYNPLTNYFGISEVALSRLLFLSALINSSYSFYWDVTKDWDLTLFTPACSDPDHPYGLRRHLYFSSPRYYYGAISIDLVIRFIWLFPILSCFKWLKYHESGIFLAMSLEVARRWMWIFFRVETEWVRNNRGPAPDDILLGEFRGKLDAD